MSAVLLILKIIGIAILCILAFLLLVILLILFCPFRYRLEGKKEEALEGKARVTWLLHFLVAEVSYAKKLNIRIKILGIPFYDRLRKKAKEKKKAAEEEEDFEEEFEEDSEEEEDSSSGDEEDSEEEAVTEEKQEEKVEEEKEDSSSGAKGATFSSRGRQKDDDAANSRGRLWDKLDDAADALEDGIDELEDMLDDTADELEEGIEKLKNKIESIADTIGYYRRILESDGALWVFDYVVKHVKGCLKNVAPKRVDAVIDFSNDDPATVAEVWKIYAVAVTLMGNIRGKREFNTKQDESSIEFKARIKGRATAVVLGYHGLCLLLNRKVKKFIKLMKREDKADGGK
ncbi:MAG: hypothetical protein K6B44_09945 [Lachnospiraceae bacterium]|nr:hypothetical protein [Lachnospiraceae bacterium]